MGRPAKHRIQEFNGVRYYWKPSGYYRADGARARYMHRDVWRFHHGPIPPDHHIHHRDGDRGNNDVANLECMHGSAHISKHSRQNSIAGSDKAKRHMANIRPAASAWHASPEGIAWHREHAAALWANREIERRACVRCEGIYEVLRGAAKRGFCSASCQSAARRAIGVDDEERSCAICGGAFMVNRYARRKTCGTTCRTEYMRRSNGL